MCGIESKIRSGRRRTIVDWSINGSDLRTFSEERWVEGEDTPCQVFSQFCRFSSFSQTLEEGGGEDILRGNEKWL